VTDFRIRAMAPSDRGPLERLLASIDNFTEAERACALELIDAAKDPAHPDYRVLVAEGSAPGALAGYACYGPTPMTRRTWDLYWIATSPEARGTGAGRAIHEAVAAAIGRAGGRIIRVETSTKETYGGTLRFYERAGYAEAGRVRDFYDDGDDLIILVRAAGREAER